MQNEEYAYEYALESAGQVDKWVIKSAQRVLQVFEFFADVRKPVSATEIAHALGFPQSSTSMLLRSLVSLGYLDYHREDRTFEPTIRLSLLGGWIPERIDVAAHIIEIANKLHEDTGETVLLAEQYRNFVRYIYIVQKPTRAHSVYFRPGLLRPICTTGHGRMLLTLNSEREVIAIVNRANAEAEDPADWINRAEFIETLKQCRQEGFSETRKARGGRMAVQAAVLLPAEAGARPLAIGIVSQEVQYRPKAEFVRERLMEIAGGTSGEVVLAA